MTLSLMAVASNCKRQLQAAKRQAAGAGGAAALPGVVPSSGSAAAAAHTVASAATMVLGHLADDLAQHGCLRLATQLARMHFQQVGGAGGCARRFAGQSGAAPTDFRVVRT